MNEREGVPAQQRKGQKGAKEAKQMSTMKKRVWDGKGMNNDLLERERERAKSY